MTLYMLVTSDKYELPIAVADSPKELATMIKVKHNTVLTLLSRAKKYNRNYCYKRVDIEEDTEDKMTREEIIKAMYDGWNCQEHDCINEKISCSDCIDVKFAEYERQIRAEVLDKINKFILLGCDDLKCDECHYREYSSDSCQYSYTLEVIEKYIKEQLKGE